MNAEQIKQCLDHLEDAAFGYVAGAPSDVVGRARDSAEKLRALFEGKVLVPDDSVILKMRDAQMLLLNVREQFRKESMWINENRLASSIQALNRAIVKAESITSSQEQGQ